MSWSGGITAASAAGASTTFRSDTSDTFAYTKGIFTAPKAGLYRFELYGSKGKDASSGGTWGEEWWSNADGGRGGYVSYYLEMSAGQTVYLGCGGRRSCAYAAKAQSGSGSHALAGIAQSNVYAVAGGGGDGGWWRDSNNGNGYNCINGAGGVGGGSTGGDGNASRSYKGGSGGTQTGPGPIDGWYKGSYGTGAQSAGGGASGYGVEGGAGGDGWYGGNCGIANAREWNGADATGGGGGSGYANNGMGHVHQYNGKSFTNSTTAGGGSTGNGYIVITYAAEPHLPVMFNGTFVDSAIVLNGTKLTSLIYNGTKLYCRKFRRTIKNLITANIAESRKKAEYV